MENSTYAYWQCTIFKCLPGYNSLSSTTEHEKPTGWEQEVRQQLQQCCFPFGALERGKLNSELSSCSFTILQQEKSSHTSLLHVLLKDFSSCTLVFLLKYGVPVFSVSFQCRETLLHLYNFSRSSLSLYKVQSLWGRSICIVQRMQVKLHHWLDW